MSQITKPNFYEILQIQPYANPALVIAAYRILSKQYHPDTAKEDANLEKFRLLQQAYETLSDPHKRLEYDRELRVTMPGTATINGNGFGYGFRSDPDQEEPLWKTHPSNEAEYTPPTAEELEFYKNLYDYNAGGRRRRALLLIGLYIILMCAASAFGFLGFLTAFGNDQNSDNSLLFFGMAVLFIILAQLEAYFS